MGAEMIDYLKKLEVMAFFSGYALLYFLFITVAGYLKSESLIRKTLIKALPLTYAFTGILFLGLQLRNLYPDFSFNQLKEEFQNPFLIIWGISTMIFFIPILNKKPVFSLLHSLPFLFFLLKDIYTEQFLHHQYNTELRNSMKVYSDSILLNFIIFLIIFFVLISIKKRFFFK